MEEEFQFLGETNETPNEPQDTNENEVSEVTEENKVETQDAEDSKPDEDTEANEEPTTQKDKTHQALDYERSKRKMAEKKLRELEAKLKEQEESQKYEEELNKRKDDLRKKMATKGNFDDETIDSLMEIFGDTQIKNELEIERKNANDKFESEFLELKKDKLFEDADNYKPKIKEFMGKGLTMEQAYFASLDRYKMAEIRKNMQVELEQKILNTNEKADKIDVGHIETKKEPISNNYTKREKEIAKATGLDVKEVRKRSGIYSLDDMLKL